MTRYIQMDCIKRTHIRTTKPTRHVESICQQQRQRSNQTKSEQVVFKRALIWWKNHFKPVNRSSEQIKNTHTHTPRQKQKKMNGNWSPYFILINSAVRSITFFFSNHSKCILLKWDLKNFMHSIRPKYSKTSLEIFEWKNQNKTKLFELLPRTLLHYSFVISYHFSMTLCLCFGSICIRTYLTHQTNSWASILMFFCSFFLFKNALGWATFR